MGRFRIVVTTGLIVILLLCNIPVMCAEEMGETVRVGFPIMEGMSYVDENGKLSGYLVDYMEQLCLFTRWNIEYVQVEGDLQTQINTLMDMLQTGEIDMLGAMNQTKTLEELFLYPTYDYGSAHTLLKVKDSDYGWIARNTQMWNEIRIAVSPDNVTEQEELAEYARTMGFTYTTVQCQNYEDTIAALQDGRADAVLQNELTQDRSLRTIARFAKKLFYFALNKEQVYLMQELNEAFLSLMKFKPNFEG